MDSTKNDAFIITETWLTDNDLDKAWVLGYELNNNGYHLLNVNRPMNTKARGGWNCPCTQCKHQIIEDRTSTKFQII